METQADIYLTLLASRGGSQYHGEQVSQLEHALQTAHLAASAGADAETVTAALLHDVGHMIAGTPEDASALGIDGRHEDAAALWLHASFGDAVIEPIRLHVAAKRYLCATNPNYLRRLSPASVQSLRVQGGPMSAVEIEMFEQSPFFRITLQLRLWDDLAKVPGLSVPGLEHYRTVLNAALSSSK